MFSLIRDFLKVASAASVVALTVTTPISANEMIQNLGPVPAHEPILMTVGNKHVIAFFVPGDGQCNVQTVIWSAVEAESARVQISLSPGQTAAIDSSPTESVTLRCGDNAETLAGQYLPHKK